MLLNLARDRGFKVLVAKTGADALSLASKYKPTAVSLDVFLPDMLGWTVLNQLKRNPAYPPYPGADPHHRGRASVWSGAGRLLLHDQDRHHRQSGGRVRPPEELHERRACGSCSIVEDDPAEQLSVSELLGHTDVEITTAATGAEALEKLRDGTFDCVVLDLKLPDMTGFELLAEVQKEPKLRDTPIIVFTGRELSDIEETRAAQEGQEHRAQGRALAGAPAR